MSQRESLEVRMDDRLVGTLALTANHKVAFSYSEEWLEHGFSVSPFSLPLKNEVFVPKKDYFDGLFGVFADSLPDAWGQLLLERLLKERGKKEAQYSVLDRLAIVGKSGMGALTYHPQKEIGMGQQMDDLDELSVHCQKILSTQYSEKLDELYRLGGTSGGARPKIMTEIDGENWIIKFPAHVDKKDVGKMEYDYSLCAKACGIVMSETRLFSSDICLYYLIRVGFGNAFIEYRHKAREDYQVGALLFQLGKYRFAVSFAVGVIFPRQGNARYACVCRTFKRIRAIF